VLAINTLRGKFKKVFYLDLDLHHGDGVENAFRYSNKVITCSIHRHEVGFFPGTGENCIGQGVVNIPTKRGLSDETLMVLINDIVIEILQKEAPEALVIQCGTDGLTADKHKEWNLSIKGMAAAIDTVMALCPVPTLLLGGGGYNHVETAKCWTYITNKVLGNDNLAGEIPDHQFVDEYEQSGYQFWYDGNTIPSKMKDMNSAEYVQNLKSAIGTGIKK
jgi:histone deacetylase HOS1